MALCATGGDENRGASRYCVVEEDVAEVVTALEPLSP
jgi:hypothetical protein